jgi:hypothetical protein
MLNKRSLFVAAIISLLSLQLNAQSEQPKSNVFTKGSWELNLSGDMGAITSTTEYKSGDYSDENSSDYKYFQFHLIPGYYFVDGLSFEPEMDFLFVEESEPAYSFIPMLSYTYLLPDNPQLALYIRAGYGFTNSYNLFGALIRQSDKLDIGIINVGAGLKILVKNNFFIRTEINYKRTSQTEEDSYYGYSYKTTSTLSNIKLLLGLSVLL